MSTTRHQGAVSDVSVDESEQPESAEQETAGSEQQQNAEEYNEIITELVEKNRTRLYRFVVSRIGHPDDAADITQQALAEAARTIRLFRGESGITTWLFGIAMNMVRNYLNRSPHRIYQFEGDESLSLLVSPACDPCTQMEQKELAARVQRVLKRLPIDLRQALVMVAIQEMPYEEVAGVLNVPLGTVRSRVSRARALVRKHMADDGVPMD